MNIRNRMAHFHVPGVSVTYFDDGEIRWSKCYGVLEAGSSHEVTPNSIFHACSMSKMVTALCILRLAQENKLSLYADVNDHLTTWRVPDGGLLAERKVTLANLLAHQAGICDIEGSFGPHEKGDVIPKHADLLRGMSTMAYAPETNFDYSDAGYCVIAQVVEDMLGETIPQLAERYIFEPLGLKRTFFWALGGEARDIFECAVGHDHNGEVVEGKRVCYPNIEGAALWTTPTEFSAIALDLLASCNGTDGTVLNAEMARLMMTPYGSSDFACLGMFYDRARDCYFSQGWGVGMQCKMRMYPRMQRGIVVMTNSEPGMEQDRALIGEIMEHFCPNDTVR